MLTPVILSGGAGTRLWPLSRELYPKQLLALTGERTMLQQTALRLEGLSATPPVVVCNDSHRFLVAEQLRQINIEPRAMVLEPFGRNTAPAIAPTWFCAKMPMRLPRVRTLWPLSRSGRSFVALISTA